MKAILLAGGEGKRLRPYTYFKAKPTFKVCGIPIIRRALYHLFENHIDEVIVNLHHKPQQIINAIRDGALYYYEPSLMGTAGTLKCLKEWVDDTFVVVDGDTLTNVDLDKMITFHKRNKNWITVFTKDSLVHNAGVFVFEKRVLDLIPFGKYSIHEDLIPDLIERDVPVERYFGSEDEYYMDCGTMKKIRKARKFYEKTCPMPKL